MNEKVKVFGVHFGWNSLFVAIRINLVCVKPVRLLETNLVNARQCSLFSNRQRITLVHQLQAIMKVSYCNELYIVFLNQTYFRNQEIIVQKSRNEMFNKCLSLLTHFWSMLDYQILKWPSVFERVLKHFSKIFIKPFKPFFWTLVFFTLKTKKNAWKQSSLKNHSGKSHCRK